MERGGVVAVVNVDGSTDHSLETVASLRRSHPELAILLAGTPGERSTELEAAASWGGDSVVSVANRAWEERRCHVLVVGAPTEFPSRALDPALTVVADDPRVGTVSFFCDDAAFLTFPRPVTGQGPARERLDPDVATRALRATGPDLLPAPIPFPVGPTVLVTSHCLSAVGPLPELDGPDAVAAAFVQFSLHARRWVFSALVDPSTFCRRRSDGGRRGAGFDAAAQPEATLVAEYGLPVSPLAVVHSGGRAKVCGLHVLIDAARLSPQEMGTQVATVALVRALARRPDVARVCVALAGELPSYAAFLRDEPKIDARVAPDRRFSVFGRVDVAHRPFQPDSPRDMDACRAVADRTAITVLDLIAYHAVSYQLAPEDWSTYRDWLRQSIAQVDGVITPSHDVRRQILLERLPVDPERLLVAELGTDHLTGDEPAAEPAAMPPPGPTVGTQYDLVVVLGADYTHKNRDLAIQAYRELRDRGFDLTLVMAGTGVHGSSRPLEDELRAHDERIVVLPDVSSEERNWLLRNASIVLYPTSGEGFGLVPFEAARFGTPTAFVPFGPLAELAGDLPVRAEDWCPTSLADAAERLLADRTLAGAQVEATVAAGDRHTWDRTAHKLADIYRSLLARPVAVCPSPVERIELDEARAQLQSVREQHDQLQRAHNRVLQSLPFKVAARAREIRGVLRRRTVERRPGP